MHARSLAHTHTYKHSYKANKKGVMRDSSEISKHNHLSWIGTIRTKMICPTSADAFFENNSRAVRTARAWTTTTTTTTWVGSTGRTRGD